MAYKVFTNGSVLNASEINDNLMNQAVMVFSNSTTRAAALTAPVEGMLTWLQDVNRYEHYDGTAWVTTTSPAGLTLITTFTASAASSLDINGCFSTNYDYYLINLRGVTSGGSRIQYRMRNAGTNDTTANYDHQTLNVDGTSLSGARETNQTSGWFSGLNTAESASFINIVSPFIARPTVIHSANVNTFNGVSINTYGARHKVSSSYDSINIFPQAGTMTITGSVYGYAK